MSRSDISRRPKVAIIAASDFASFPTGGTTTFVRNMIENLDLPLVVVGVDAEEAMARRTAITVGSRSLPYVSLGVVDAKSRLPRRVRVAARAWQARRAVAGMDVDVLYVHSPEIVLALGAQKLPLVYHMHGASTDTTYSPHRLFRNPFGSWVFRGMVDEVARRSRGVLGVNEECRAYAERVAAHFRLVPTCVDTRLFKPAERIPDGELRLGYVGRLDRVKAIPLIIDVLAELTRVGVQARLTIAGDGPVLADLKAYAGSRDMGGRVEFVGRVERKDLPSLLARLDVFMMASLFEGLPTAMLEAMACGAVVVAPSLPGIEAVLSDGVNGLVYVEREAANIASRILRMRGGFPELSAAAVRTVEPSYSAITVANVVAEELMRVSHGQELRSVAGDVGR